MIYSKPRFSRAWFIQIRVDLRFSLLGDNPRYTVSSFGINSLLDNKILYSFIVKQNTNVKAKLLLNIEIYLQSVVKYCREKCCLPAFTTLFFSIDVCGSD